MADIDNVPISEFEGRSYNKGYVTVKIDTIGIDLSDFAYRTRKAVKYYLSQCAAPDVRRYMVANHKWDNRTRTAEVGLTCDVETKGNMKSDDFSIKLRMYHTAVHNGYEYGRALEGIDPIHGVIRKDLGVLDDTLRLYMPIVVQNMKGIVDRYS